MYELISTKQAAMSRNVTLKNTITGTEDSCYDDSEFPGYEYEGFYFMKPGEFYDCKIELVGSMKGNSLAKRVSCCVQKNNVICGHVAMMEVKAGEDVYYIRCSEMEGWQGETEFDYYCSRKDLIQVNDVVNHHMIWGV